MRSRLRSALALCACLVLLSCGAARPTAARRKPSDRIGTMLLTNQLPPTEPAGIGDYCPSTPMTTQATTTVSCTAVPPLALFGIRAGWNSATPQELDAAWASLQSQVTVDGQDLDLPSFGTQDTTNEDGSRRRAWRVWLGPLTPGSHTVQVIWHVVQAINDSRDTVAVGDYATIYQFTVK